jgi:hypothetical protein
MTFAWFCVERSHALEVWCECATRQAKYRIDPAILHDDFEDSQSADSAGRNSEGSASRPEPQPFAYDTGLSNQRWKVYD